MDDSQDFSSFREKISSMLIDTTRVVNQLHSRDLSFYRSLDPTVSATLDKQNARLLNLAECLLKTAVSGTEVEAPDVKEIDELDNNWNGIVEVVDSLFERADMCLDEYTGTIKKPSAVEEEAVISRPLPPKRNPINVLRTRNDLPKPQLLFKRKPLNGADGPFKPLLTTKPHAVLPLAQSLGTAFGENGYEQSKHPYETEILQLQYPSSVYTKSTPIPYPSFESTTATWVDTPEAVASMLRELKASKEIAVDLEHHDARSYVGLVSLMQISTREKDWIVDTLKPWREGLQVLNEVFADPGIVKVGKPGRAFICAPLTEQVFHGAYMDIVWLQRDLGLYVVGLFDTYHAASALGYAGQSLAFLLKKFVGFTADKQYQRADWRIRPLTGEMFKYARSDTHFLLYIYDNLRNELIDKSNPAIPYQNYVEDVLARSKETALQTYVPDIYDEISGDNATGWSNMLQKTPTNFTNEQFSVFKAIHQWRDKTARQTDESLNYVMPKQILFSMARTMPADVQSLFALSRDIPPLVKVRASELVRTIKQAKENAGKNPTHTPSRGSALKGKAALGSSGAIALPKGPGIRVQTGPFRDTWDSEATTRVNVSLDQTIDRVVHAKTAVSRFWGAAFGSSLWHPGERANLINEGIRLAVPLPQLTAEIFESEVTVGQDPPIVDQEIPVEHQYVKKRKAAEPDDENIFVVKQLGGGRKRKLEETKMPAASVSDAGGGSPEGTTADCDMDKPEAEDLAQESRDARKERRRLRKEEKKRRKMEQAGQSGEVVHNRMETSGGLAASVDEKGQEPFDYAAAPSVLHGKAEVPDRSGSRKAFNPYAKSGDTSRGMHRSRKEVPGKSTTFKR